MKKKSEAIYRQEKKATAIIRKNHEAEFLFGNRAYRLGSSLFDILPVGWEPDNKVKLSIMILSMRAIEYLRSIEILLSKGYLLESASLSANLIEIYLFIRKIMVDGEVAANEWINHDKDYICWKLTGKNKNKLFSDKYVQRGAEKFEAMYKYLCSLKHSQSKSIKYNYGSEGKRHSLYNAPLIDEKVISGIFKCAQLPTLLIIQDARSTLQGHFKSNKLKLWQRKFERLTFEVVEAYKQVRP